MKQTHRKKLAVAIGCMLLYSGWTPAVFAAGSSDEAVEVEDVEVTDTRLRERLALKKTEITAETIKSTGATNAAQALEKEAGIVVSSNNAQGKTAVSIRGSDATNTKVFVDGVPLSSVGDNIVDLSNIPAENIEKIEVYKGAVPAQYGSDAAGGVIYITTKKGGEKGAAFSTAVGSWNTLRQTGSMSGGDRHVNYIFSYKNETTDGYTINSKVNSTYYDGKFDFRLNNSSSLSLFGSHIKKYQELPDRYDANGVPITNPGTGMQVGNPGTVQQPGGTRRGTSFWYQTFDLRLEPLIDWRGGMVYNQRFSENSNLKVTMYRSGETQTMNALRPDNITGGQSSDNGVRGLQVEHTLATSPVNTVLWGYNYERRWFTQDTRWQQVWGMDPATGKLNTTPFSTLAQYNYSGNSYFFQDTLKKGKLTTALGYRQNVINDHLVFTPGKYYYDEEHKRPIDGGYTPLDLTSNHTFRDPVWGVNYAVSDRTELHGSIGKSFRYPTPTERAGFVTVGSSAEVGAYLQPEQALNRELGVAYTAPGGLHFDVTGFYKTVTDKIKSQTVVGQTTYVHVAQPVAMKGFETEITKKFNDRLKAVMQYSYTVAQDPVEDRQISDQSKHKASLAMQYESNQGLKAYLALNYMGSRFSDFSNGSSKNQDASTGANDTTQPPEFRPIFLPAYHTVDFMLRKEKSKNREVYVKLNNLTDTKYCSAAYLVAPGRYTEFGTNIKF